MAYLNKIATALALTMLAGVVSCTKVAPIDVDDIPQAKLLERDKKKWAEEDALLAKNKADSAAIAEENKRLRELYLEDLRAYKKSKHMVMFGWFAYWNPTSPDKTFSLDHLPDSVDFVSNWGQQWNLDEVRKGQLARLQEKGTRMTAGFIIENVGDGLQNAPEGGWPSDPDAAVDAYAKALCDSIAKYNYDGIDIDYEPAYRSPFKDGNHCGDWEVPTKIALISCDRSTNKERENRFFRKIRELLPAEKMLNINGSIDYLDKSVTGLFNYFVYQSYNNTATSWLSTTSKVMRENSSIKPEQFIYTETFQTAPNKAASFVKNYAEKIKNLQGQAGGIGAFHINEDYLYGPEYKNVKAAISLLNPPFSNQ